MSSRFRRGTSELEPERRHARVRQSKAGVAERRAPARTDHQVWRSNCWQIPNTTAASIMTAAISMTSSSSDGALAARCEYWS
jgi:hypothetical protein